MGVSRLGSPAKEAFYFFLKNVVFEPNTFFFDCSTLPVVVVVVVEYRRIPCIFSFTGTYCLVSYSILIKLRYHSSTACQGGLLLRIESVALTTVRHIESTPNHQSCPFLRVGIFHIPLLNFLC